MSIVIRGGQLGATLSQYLVDRMATTPNIDVPTHPVVVEVEGDQMLRAISIADRRAGATRTVPTGRLFIW